MGPTELNPSRPADSDVGISSLYSQPEIAADPNHAHSGVYVPETDILINQTLVGF